MSHVKLNVGRKKQNCVVVVIGFSLLASVLVLSSAAFCESSSQELQFPLRVSEQQITQRMDPRTIVNVGSVPPLKERFTTADRARMLAAVSASQQGPAKPLARTVGAVRYYAYNVEFDGKES